MHCRRYLLLPFVCLALLMPLASNADTVSFFCLTNNSGVCSSLAPQFSVNVTNAGSGVVDFQFNNGTVPGYASTIKLAMVDQGTTGLFSGFAVPNFSYPSNPPANVSFAVDNTLTLPGGNSSPWLFTTDFGAKATPPAPHNGVELGEAMILRLALNSGKTFSDVQNALAIPGTTGLRLGIHVISINIPGVGSGYSEGMLSNPVPEPSFIGLLGLGLAGLIGAARRRRRQLPQSPAGL